MSILRKMQKQRLTTNKKYEKKQTAGGIDK